MRSTVVLVVKFIRGSNIQESCVPGVWFRTSSLETFGEGFVHGRILGWIKTIGEGCGVAYADGVGT